MFPIENATSRTRFSLLETSPETLDIVQQLDFSSFADSEISEKHCNNAVEVASASDDPFDSDDLEELLKIYPPSTSPSKPPAPLSQSTQRQLEGTPAARAFSGPCQPVFPAFSQVQKPQQVMSIKIESEPIKTESAPGNCFLEGLASERWSDFSSPEPYFSCKSDTKEEIEPREAPSFQENSSKFIAEPSLNNTTTDSAQSSAVKREPVCFSSPKVSMSPAAKRARFSSPQKFQSYESQMQYRSFATSAAPMMPQTSKSAPDWNPTIQLATQKAKLNLPQSQDLATDARQSREPEKVVTAFRLSKEQNHVLELALEGKSIFFTGSAGTGKSILLKSIIKALKQQKGPGAVAVTASTGLAACNIGGITLHSFAGIGLGKGDLKSLVKTVRRNRKAVVRWKETEVLIIDEISMIDGRMFHNLDQIARGIRRKGNTPFGGMQLIVCGDFYQLPPVSKNEVQADGTSVKEESVFAFESGSWDSTLDHSIVLKEVFRQKGDQDFIDMLNDMRHGIVSFEAESEFRRLIRPLECPEGIVPTELYATRSEVDRANSMKLQKIKGEIKHYVAKDGGSLPPAVKAQMLNNFLAPRELILKENAQVMCIKNIDDTLVNGSLGKIIKFVDRDTYMCERVENENPNLDFEQFTKEMKKKRGTCPYESESDNIFNFLTKKHLLAEKSDQKRETAADSKPKDEASVSTSADGIKCEADEVEGLEAKQESQSMPDVFEAGSSFISIENENAERKANFMKELLETSRREKYPLVRFLCPDGVTTRDHLMEPERWEITDDKTEEILVSRIQFPLMLAWALSIHKSQGQTLQKVKVDLARIFENGQAYVALSRAVSRTGLQVLNFRKERVRAHPIVESFYGSLVSSDEIGIAAEKTVSYEIHSNSNLKN